MNLFRKVVFVATTLVFCFFVASCVNQTTTQEPNQTDSTFYTNDMTDFSIVFYNTENFYDTIDDPDTFDDEFTPHGRIPWTAKRFNKKVWSLSKVLSEIVKPQMPDLIGLAEVENRSVLEDLIQSQNLQKTDYGIVHYESPDERGSDVALLYNNKTFRVKFSEPLKVSLLGVEDRTRDILYVVGTTSSCQEIHVFINHWPSRREGQQQSEIRRVVAADVLRAKVDEIFNHNASANIIAIGDFNDNPENKTITEIIVAQKPSESLRSNGLYNLLYPRFKKGFGTLYYKSWDLFDQIIVSGNLMNQENSLHCTANDADIFNPKWLLYRDRKGHFEPNRTMSAKYYGGYSDHLPVFLRLRQVKAKTTENIPVNN